MVAASNKTKGRQKVPMVKMARMSNLQVTFSKRRSGLFKKASELCTMCDADVALIVFSPGDKVFSFGHPSVDSVVDRYVSGSHPPPPNASRRVVLSEDDEKNATLRDLNAQLTEVGNQLEAARKQGEDIAAAMEEEREGRWWHNPVESMEKQQLEQLSACLDDLGKTVSFHSDRLRTFANLARQMGPTHHHGLDLFDPNNIVPFLPPPPPLDYHNNYNVNYNPPDDHEFEQKVNVLGGGPPPPPPPHGYDPMMSAAMMMPGYSNFYGPPHFNPFGYGFF